MIDPRTQYHVDYSALVEAVNLNTRELRKLKGLQRLNCVLEFFSPDGVVGQLFRGRDSCRVTFTSQGKKVKAQKLIVSNQSLSPICFTVNETIIPRNPTSGNHNGITVQGFQQNPESFQIITGEVQYIEIALNVAGGVNTIAVNNSQQGVPVGGIISVYAWSIPDTGWDEIDRNTYDFP